MANDWFKRLFSFTRRQAEPMVEPGLYHAMQEADGLYTRFHLRVERDSTGMLIANANAAARLSPSGVIITKGLLEGKDVSIILADLKAQFSGATQAVMRADIEKVKALIQEIISPGDTYPMFNLEDAALSPYEAQLIAPLQASVPLAPPEQLIPILDKLWAAGIPHVTLLAPEKPERAHLLAAIERAEDLGMIAGVRAKAGDLQDETLLSDLAMAGVDHVTILYAAADADVHDALLGQGDHAAATAVLNWLEENQVCAVTEVPLVQATLDILDDTVEHLMSLGADNVSFAAYPTTDEELAQKEGVFTAFGMTQVASTVEEAANEAQARFMWNPPVQRALNIPLAQQILNGPRCSGDVAIRVEADGSVIPPRGPYQSAGNILHDSWDTIWDHEVFRIYRERVQTPTHCDICPGLVICAADCPREPAGWSQEKEI
jgi:radical SAM protein with 4Fe4S-binding SPASM domain